MLDLRVRSAINALKRMNLDLARMKSVTESGGTGLEDIKRKSDELSRYIGDLEDGYEELNRSRSGDPYGE
jgi:archaellum component FlaC